MVCTMAMVLSLTPRQTAIAQDLVITNARIIDGTGQTIERGSIAIAGGRISLVSDAIVGPGDFLVIDAQGMTVMPGFIDTHRHDIAFGTSDAEVAAALEVDTPANPAFTAPGGFPIPVICQRSEYCADNATVQVTDPQVARGEVRT